MPALLACEYAMAQLWKSWGVEPDAMIGHSMGEYTAACLAGVMSLEDALALVTVRGRLFEKLAPGSMTSVAIPEAELRPLLPEGLSIAAVNAPELCVASGEAAAIAALERALAERGIEHRPIRIAVAAHSAMVEPILGEFRDFVSSIRLSAPTIPYVSNVTGDWVTPEQAQSPEYWVQHLRSTVRFADGVQKLLGGDDRLVLEVGPGQTLTSLARLAGEDSAERALASLPRPKHDESARHAALTTLGRLWQAGKTIDWEGFHAADPRQRISLPTYPFERKRYWIDADPEVAPGIPADAQPAAADPLASLFHRPVWKRSTAPYTAQAEGEWLVFADPSGPSGRLVDSIASSIPNLTYVEAGERFAQLGPNRFTVQPGSADDHLKLVQALKQRGSFPSRIAHFWSVTTDDESPQRMLELGFYSLLFLAQALSAEAVDEELSLSVVSNHMQRVRDEALLHSEKATLLGVCRVIPQELQNVRCQSLDLSELEDIPAASLLAELSGADDAAETTIAYRGGARWVQTVETSPLPAAEDGRPRCARRACI
ncbi:MAG: acyltransferase domain-containing protein [Bryobacterales bacterium]